MTLYKILDIFFLVFHTMLIAVNLFGWAWRPLRRINLITLLLTGASWFILGLFYGIGYCPLTDWHFDVLERLGKNIGTNSYIDYLTERLTGINFNESFIDIFTITLFFAALGFSLFFNLRRGK